MKRAVAWLLLATAVACKAVPQDPFVVGEAALLADDLAGALLAYDAVPVAHARYPEARAAAAGVERRMRRSHEILLEGLLLRSEWRDREALALLLRAREVWPRLPGIDALITATEHRLGLFAAAPAAVPVAVGGSTGDPGAADDVRPSPPGGTVVQTLEVPETEPGAAGTALPEAAVAAADAAPAPASGDDAVAVCLVDIERRLGRGEFEAAVAQLLELAQRFPVEPRVQVRLARLLHQRALIRYGQGAVDAAIEDWAEVLRIEPQHRLARSLLRAARAESAAAVPAR